MTALVQPIKSKSGWHLNPATFQPLGSLEMSDNSVEIEMIRDHFKPRRITTLFVGESPPNSGKFFYCGDTILKRNFSSSVTRFRQFQSGDFLNNFEALRWYLDDLAHHPVDHLPPTKRKAQLRLAVPEVAKRIRAYSPDAIVIILKRIERFVREAATQAECRASIYALPFPANGHQAKFKQQMIELFPHLPKAR